MAKQRISSPVLACLPQICRLIFFLRVLPVLVLTYYHMQFNRKLKSHTWGNNEKPNLGANFEPFGPNLGPAIVFVSFTNLKEN